MRLVFALRRNHALRSTCRGVTQCKVCLQPFICTSAEAKLREHSDNKHPKATFKDCFPDFQPKA